MQLHLSIDLRKGMIHTYDDIGIFNFKQGVLDLSRNSSFIDSFINLELIFPSQKNHRYILGQKNDRVIFANLWSFYPFILFILYSFYISFIFLSFLYSAISVLLLQFSLFPFGI